MTLVLIGVAGALVGALALALLEVTIRRAELGATLVFLSAIVQAVFIYSVPSVRLPGGERLGITDVVAVTILAAAVARCLRLTRFGRYQRWLILLGLLLLVSLLFGIVRYGIQASVNDSRQYVFFVGAALYMATFRPTGRLYDKIGRAWLITAALMVLLAGVRWLAVFGGIDLGVPAERNGVDAAVRVLDGPYAFFLAGPVILTIRSWTRRDGARWLRWLGVVLVVVVLALDRRTVWLTILIGVAVLLLRGRRLGARGIALVAAASIVTALAFAGDVLTRDETPPGTVSSTGSVTWRIEGWSDLVTSWSASPVNWMVGEPFGSGFARVVEGSKVTAHPHNFYIETMIRGGAGGLIALLALTVGLLRRLWKAPSHPTGLFDPGVLTALLAMQLTWYLTWVPGIEQGIVVGMAIAVVAAQEVTPDRLPLRPAGPLRAKPQAVGRAVA